MSHFAPRSVPIARESSAGEFPGLVVHANDGSPGQRGRTGRAALVGVSERVAHRAGCSVLVVRRAAHPVREEDPTLDA